ncbi:MAG: acyltransferase [Bacteroidales bacterium]|nr:acyltransferase [Bacteroidales bacterium]
MQYDKKRRNVSIDILKCFAALLITNSHMGMLYGKYDFLATGGCIGDVLFFFCSGFTLFLKPMEGIKQFPNWYKKRINRIYPSIIAVAFLGALFFNVHQDVIDITLGGGNWFIACIMLYYVAIYFIGSYFKNRIFMFSVLVALGTAVWFYFACQTPGFSIYGGHYIRWLLFFVFMLLGAKLGTMTDQIKSRPLFDLIMLILCVAVFYALFIGGTHYRGLVVLQYFSFMPLLGAMYYFYKVGASKVAERIYNSKVGNFFIRFIGGLCLEIYLVQFFLFTDKMNSIFPLNILIMFLIIFAVAYLTRCLARLISQMFNDAPFDWRKMISLY